MQTATLKLASWRSAILASTFLRRYVPMFLLVLGALVSGTWSIVRVTTEGLLYQDATTTAHSWARHLAENVADLEQIAGGELPSNASMAFFEGSRKTAQVFRYAIFNREGLSQLVSDREKIALVSLSRFSPEAAHSARTGEVIVDVREGDTQDWPAYYAQAYVPVVVNGHTVAIVAAYVDQTQRRSQYAHAFVKAALLLSLITGLSFVVPGVAWFHRTMQQQRANRRIRFLAMNDALTGLANRASLTEALEKALGSSSRSGEMLAVHFLDLDRFKEVNDTLGHDAGDFLLKAVAARLSKATRADDILARIGGDEFVVVQKSAASRDEAGALAERLIKELAQPLSFAGHQLMPSASVGVAIAPGDGNTAERLLKSADIALYASKSGGRNCYRLFEPGMDAALRQRQMLEAAIRNAITHDTFELHYQPVFSIPNNELSGFEALLRLKDADGRYIPPMVFIPIAEEMRLIGDIGAWVLKEACRTALSWPENLTIAVNLSPAQFSDGSISERVCSILEETGLPPSRLELEITESLLLGDNELVLGELRKLKAAGVAIAMDDFGTGYSSLSYLWRFPFDRIKIDRAFMLGFDGSAKNAAMVVNTIIALGRQLDMRVTVEGVETSEQVDFLHEAAADHVQGYYYGKPAPASELAPILLDYFRRGAPEVEPVLDHSLRFVAQ